jgi:hypothetical protein
MCLNIVGNFFFFFQGPIITLYIMVVFNYRTHIHGLSAGIVEYQSGGGANSKPFFKNLHFGQLFELGLGFFISQSSEKIHSPNRNHGVVHVEE